MVDSYQLFGTYYPFIFYFFEGLTFQLQLAVLNDYFQLCSGINPGFSLRDHLGLDRRACGSPGIK